jgi:Cytochrome P450
MLGAIVDLRVHLLVLCLLASCVLWSGLVKEDARPTIFSALMDPREGFSKGAVDNLEDEAYTIITAAADTTGNAMTTMTRWVVENPDIYHKLHSELCEAFPDSAAELNYAALEKLPYLVSSPVFLWMHCG